MATRRRGGAKGEPIGAMEGLQLPPGVKLRHTLRGHTGWIGRIAWSPDGRAIASPSGDNTVRLWDAETGQLLRTLTGNQDGVSCVAFAPAGRTLASGSEDHTVKLWDVTSGQLTRTLEGHTGPVEAIGFSADGRLFVSKGSNGFIQIWHRETWQPVAAIQMPPHTPLAGLAFHPTSPLLATVDSDPDASGAERDRLIHIWELDLGTLLGQSPRAKAPPRAVHHTTAKIVLVGDHSVGKSALAYRLVRGAFKEQASTHGQQFWVYPELSQVRQDGTECEAIL